MDNRIPLNDIIAHLVITNMSMGDSLYDDICYIYDTLGIEMEETDDDYRCLLPVLLNECIDKKEYTYIKEVMFNLFDPDSDNAISFNENVFFEYAHSCGDQSSDHPNILKVLNDLALYESSSIMTAKQFITLGRLINDLESVDPNLLSVMNQMASGYYQYLESDKWNSVKTNDHWTIGEATLGDPYYKYEVHQDIVKSSDYSYITAYFTAQNGQIYVDFTKGQKTLHNNCLFRDKASEVMIKDASYKVNLEGDYIKELANHFDCVVGKRERSHSNHLPTR